MPMNRTHMRRQLYKGGGIADLYPREKFGAGSWLKKKVRNLIPNELADVAVKAAPFVAMIPGQQGTAALMRGIGRFDQRGSISDALKQGAATYGFGKYVAPAIRQGASNLYQGAQSKIGGWSGPEGGFRQKAKELAFGRPEITKSDIGSIMKEGVDPGLAKHVASKEVIKGTPGLLGFGGDFNLKKAWGKGIPAVFAGSTLASLAIQKAMGDVGGREAGESLTAFNKRRESTVSNYLAYYYKRANKFRIPPEELEQKTAEFVKQNTTEYRTEENQGGRIGYAGGTENNTAEIEKRMKEETPRSYPYLGGLSPITFLRRFFHEKEIEKEKKKKTKKAQGGRIGQMYGTGPQGLPGIPRRAPDGMEFDMRMNGGFQGLGKKEGKDDVPAMLAKNEFVFTADAVRGAGGGDIELGAQKMYDTMKNLEKRMA